LVKTLDISLTQRTLPPLDHPTGNHSPWVAGYRLRVVIMPASFWISFLV
jgi:hypothetical protein